MKFTKTTIRGLALIVIGLGLALVGIFSTGFFKTPRPDFGAQFNGQRALADVEQQLSFGPRTPGSPGHAQAVDWILSSLREAGWEAEVQRTTFAGQDIQNIIARRSGGASGDWVILGAHYDTRIVADQDPDPANRSLPVPGANDGASGVAVLLELARVLPADLETEVWLVFFDAEDNGNLPGLDWILGSSAFVELLEGQPDAAVILDMVGDADLNLYLEQNSDLQLSASIWAQAAALGYEEFFIPLPKYSMLDDHTPFLRAGIPAVDIIDFDYPYWHTVEDTLDKVSAESLEAVGATLLAWLIARK